MGANSAQGIAFLLFLIAFVPIAVGMAGSPLLLVLGLLLLAASIAAMKKTKSLEASEE